jgi:predicted nucleotidyltransferase
MDALSRHEEQLGAVVAEQPYPLLFVTVSGAHLYGFPSPDSDYDLRGVHVLPAKEVVGLETGLETIEVSEMRGSLEIDLVSHDAKKFFALMLKKNGYVLEQLFSPLVLHTSEVHEELKVIGRDCLTRHHSHHYFGFAETQWRLFENERPRRVKPLLYVYRVLLTGIHLMRAGIIEANLLRLNEDFKLPYLDELVARKTGGTERATLDDAEMNFYRFEYERLRLLLEESYQASALPERPAGGAALHELLVRLRLSPEYGLR